MAHYPSTRKRKSFTSVRSRRLARLILLPGLDRRPPSQHRNHEGALIARNRIQLNCVAVREGRISERADLPFPGVGVSKHPMTIVTQDSTFMVGWALRDGTRPIWSVGESAPLEKGTILFLKLGEPMVCSGAGDALLLTKPVIFISRHWYSDVPLSESALESWVFESEGLLTAARVVGVRSLEQWGRMALGAFQADQMQNPSASAEG